MITLIRLLPLATTVALSYHLATLQPDKPMDLVVVIIVWAYVALLISGLFFRTLLTYTFSRTIADNARRYQEQRGPWGMSDNERTLQASAIAFFHSQAYMKITISRLIFVLNMTLLYLSGFGLASIVLIVANLLSLNYLWSKSPLKRHEA